MSTSTTAAAASTTTTAAASASYTMTRNATIPPKTTYYIATSAPANYQLSSTWTLNDPTVTGDPVKLNLTPVVTAGNNPATIVPEGLYFNERAYSLRMTMIASVVLLLLCCGLTAFLVKRA